MSKECGPMIGAPANNLTYWAEVHSLLRNSFQYMEGRIDPPSSLEKMTPQSIADFAHEHLVWTIDDDARPVACLFLQELQGCLYLGKLAVAISHRGQLYASSLILAAENHARQRGLECLRLEVRVELTENHKTFEKMGFSIVGETAHSGFDRPTSYTMEKTVSPA